MKNLQTPYEDLIIPLDMSSLSVKAKHGTDPSLQMSPSMRRKVVNPMYTLDMNRAKTVNSIEEQQLSKKLKDLEKQQNKMRSDMLQMKASLLPEIMVTSASGDKNTHPGGLLTGDASQRTRKRSGSLPPVITSSETEKARLGGGSSEIASSTKSFIAPTPPSQPIHRARSMNEFDRGRPRVRPKSAILCPGSETAEARRRSFQCSKSTHSSVESLPSELSHKSGSNPTVRDSGSHEDVTVKQRTKSTSALLPLRKAISTSNLSKVRRATVDTADLASISKHDKNSIFRNSSYNPVLLNPTLPPSHGPNTSNGARRRRSSPLRLNQLSLDSAQAPTDSAIPSLQAQFEQLKACRYLRVPSDEGEQ